MVTLLRAVVTGFGLSLGAAIFKKHVQKRLGLEDEDEDDKADNSETLQRQDGGTDPGLQAG
jgi:hypothetical protein